MKIMLITLLITVSVFANAQVDIQGLAGNNLNQESNAPVTGSSSMQEVEKQVAINIKQKCNKNGCIVYVDQSSGQGFRIGANAGIGNQFGNGQGGGIAIIDTNGNFGNQNQSQLSYGGSVSFDMYKVTCKHMIPESVFRYIETYIRLISTPEFAAKVMKKAELGEDMPMPEPVKLAFMTLATVKPTQGQCSGNDSRNR